MKLDPVNLHSPCAPVTFDQPKKNIAVAHTLLRLMAKERGIGLAANQCGLLLRVFVMRIGHTFYHCFNPEILEEGDGLEYYNEGCLSFSGEHCNILRPSRILVRYYSADGKPTQEWLDGLAARCFQHELDHLNGLTMFDRLELVTEDK